MLGSKTLRAYQEELDQMEKAKFKARSLDKNLFANRQSKASGEGEQEVKQRRIE